MKENSFSKKEILRARRDLQACMEDVINNTGRIMFHTNIKRFIKLVESNDLLKFLLNPFWGLNVSNVEDGEEGDWIDLNIPVEIDYQIAYVLNKYKSLSKEDNEYCIHNFLHSVYKNNASDDNAEIWNESIVEPCFREIGFRLSDLIEDLPNEEEVNVQYMSIINVGNINNSNGNIGIGEDIKQSNNSYDIFNDIIKLINENITGNERNQILDVVKEMENNKGNPSFKKKVGEFISATANYGPTFISMWDQLQKMF